MSIQTFDESSWEESGVRGAVRRIFTFVALVFVVVGPIALGGALGWMLTREQAPVLGEDGWVRSRVGLAGGGAGFPLISSAELEAAGVSVEDARNILKR